MIIFVHTLILIFSCMFAGIILLEILSPFGIEQINVIVLNEILKGNKADYQYIDVRPENEFN